MISIKIIVLNSQEKHLEKNLQESGVRFLIRPPGFPGFHPQDFPIPSKKKTAVPQVKADNVFHPVCYAGSAGSAEVRGFQRNADSPLLVLPLVIHSDS